MTQDRGAATKHTVGLAEAERVAAGVLADLAPACARIQVAGSVRRGVPRVGDLEILATPRYTAGGLFGDRRANALWAALHARAPRYRFLKGDRADGRYYQLALAGEDGLPLDLFLAEPDNWGWILLLRTGSAEFSQRMLTLWKRAQGLGRDRPGSVDGRLVRRDGRAVETPEEETVFRLLGMAPVPPEGRAR